MLHNPTLKQEKTRKYSASPRVSVIIPVYNTGKYLAQCLESVLRQTFADIEVIAVDDGSTDDSLQILGEYRNKDARVKVFRNPGNRGVSYTLNQALNYASATVVARMDSDDIMVEDRIEKQYAFLEANPDCIVVGGQVGYINERDEVTGGACFPLTDQKIKNSFFYFQAIADPTVMFHRDRIPEAAFVFDENLVVAEGLDLYFRLFQYGRFANLPDRLVWFRQREGSLTKNLKRTFACILKVRLKAMTQYGVKAPGIAVIVNVIQKAVISIMPFFMVVWLLDFVKKMFYQKDMVRSES